MLILKYDCKNTDDLNNNCEFLNINNEMEILNIKKKGIIGEKSLSRLGFGRKSYLLKDVR